MFSGIVETIGEIRSITPTAGGVRLSIRAPFEGLEIGESVCVSGVCLTVVTTSPIGFDAEVSAETMRRSKFGRLRVGDAVNLERSLRLGDRLSGHLVFGHVDGVGRLRAIEREGDSALFEFDAPPEVSRYLVEKGSVAADGVSLTVFRTVGGAFTVAVIPHTARVTTLGRLRPGDEINLESDVIAKYVETLARPYSG